MLRADDAGGPLQRPSRREVAEKMREMAGKLTGLAALLEADEAEHVAARQANLGDRIIEDIVDGKG